MKKININKYILLFVMAFTITACGQHADNNRNKHAKDILGNPEYMAFSYGGYRHSTRDSVPSVSDIKEDLRILSAMGVKILRTYNTSHFMQATNLLEAIHQLKEEDSDFEMYVMLGAWIDCEGAWTNNANHQGEDFENNKQEVDHAVELANEYPDIVKVIAVGNEAMVYWAASYYVTPRIILKWVIHLQDLKAKGEIPGSIWITSSDNFASWGGQKIYQNDDLAELIRAVDYVSLHTYPFHETHYNSQFWISPDSESNLGKTEKIDAAMNRAVSVAKEQYQSAAKYIQEVSPDKEIHIGETGWATNDASFYGKDGNHAADEYKQKLFYDYIRKWTNENGMSCFFFEAFDEKWKDSGDPMDSENHFGLIKLNGKAKYTLWNYIDEGKFIGLTRGGNPITKTYEGNFESLMRDVYEPPKASDNSKFQITTVNTDRKPGELIKAETLVVLNNTISPDKDGLISYPGAILKLNTWDATCTAELSADGIIEVSSGSQEWWGFSLELLSDETGENMTNFADGYLNFSVRSNAKTDFQLGYQTGYYNKDNQVNNFVMVGPERTHKVKNNWISHSVSISELDNGGNLANVTSLLFLRGEKGFKGKIWLKEIYYTRK